MRSHGLDELVRLVLPAPGVPLLAPSAGRGPALHPTPTHLDVGEPARVGKAHGIPAAAHEDQPQRVVRETDTGDAAARPAQPDRAGRSGRVWAQIEGRVTGDRRAVVLVDPSGQHRLEAFRRDLEAATDHVRG